VTHTISELFHCVDCMYQDQLNLYTCSQFPEAYCPTGSAQREWSATVLTSMMEINKEIVFLFHCTTSVVCG
jgi:hypothetical protein